jgi:hypothetical protein
MPPDLARRLKGEENYKIKHIPKLKFCSAFWSIRLPQVIRHITRIYVTCFYYSCYSLLMECVR